MELAAALAVLADDVDALVETAARVGEEVMAAAQAPQDDYLHTGSDEFGTPDYIFKPLNDEFHFTFDAAASAENAKCPLFFTKEDNALALRSWVNEANAYEVDPVFWCNPPYSRGNVSAFIKKAYEESQNGATVVLLVPARTEQDWFHDIVLPNAEVRFVRGRIKFNGGKTSARQSHMVIIFPKQKIRVARARFAAVDRYRLTPKGVRHLEPRCVK